jgi:CHAT domain-containing protein
MSGSEPIIVSVVHGDLREARYPLAVGHYRRDVIVNAEAALDAALDGALRRRFDLGLYPGELGTAEVVRRGVHPPGAIVIGLGNVGELTPERLRSGVAMALRRYALSILEHPPEDDTAQGPLSAAFSSVLIGTDGGALGAVPDFIHAIVRGALDANRSLRDADLESQVRVDRIEFIELYEDMAIRAAHVVARLPGTLASELKADEKLEVEATIAVGQGGRFLRPADPYAVGWWQRISVRRKPFEGAPGTAPPPNELTTALQFTVLTDRARLEQEVSVAQRTLVQRLITTATGRQTLDLDLSSALYQLVVPEQVRDRISQGGDLLFMVDRAGAAYPFELMAQRQSDGEPVPLALTRGILRQFETDQYRLRPEMARSNRIFIVGNPKTILFADLPGAQAEAEEVRTVVEEFQLEPVQPPRDDPERTIVALVTGEYRILHFAAHGQYDADPMKSGVVIGDRLFITPAEVARLALVPELAFLNCCYLGTMDAARPAGPDPRLAASLAEGFIQAGVRAVIAAGWAVDDAAGRTFAGAFYREFLGGATFGDAVKAARDRTRTEHPNVNTWGAYQCYGNPDYRFRPAQTATRVAASVRFVARSEALQALRTLAAHARSSTPKEVDDLARQFETLRSSIPAQWLEEGELLSACGQISGELEKFDEAIEFYRKALSAVPAAASFTVAEQLANLLSRSAANLVTDRTAAECDYAKRFEDAVAWLDWLDRQLAPSKERLALRGALYKRWAVCDRQRRRELLTRASAAYDSAAKLAGNAGYQQLNALALSFVLGAVPRDQLQAIAADYVERARQSRRAARDRNFWSIVEEPDTLLYKHVIDRTLGTESALAAVKDGYARARRIGPSLRQWASVRDQVWFLAEMVGDPDLPCCDPATASALKELLAFLSDAPATRQNARIMGV